MCLSLVGILLNTPTPRQHLLSVTDADFGTSRADSAVAVSYLRQACAAGPAANLHLLDESLNMLIALKRCSHSQTVRLARLTSAGTRSICLRQGTGAPGLRAGFRQTGSRYRLSRRIRRRKADCTFGSLRRTPRPKRDL